MTFEEREELVGLWRGRSAQTKARYELAAEQTRERANEILEGSASEPEERYALRKAVHEENIALAEHLRTLKTCLGILRGEMPNGAD